MPTVEIPHATDREGRAYWEQYEARKRQEFKLKIANEYRLAKSDMDFFEWVKYHGLLDSYEVEEYAHMKLGERGIEDDD